MHQIELLKKYGLSVRGARGQHLLVDENIQRKLVQCVAPRPNETIVEIGPGLGAVTELLVRSKAEVIAVEQDKRFIQILEGELGQDYRNLKLVHGDILSTDLKKFVKRNSNVRVVGNIPYYITSPILLYLISYRSIIDSVYLTLQREIADRIFAQPGTKAYGRLSVLVRYYADVRRLFEISRNCFSPRPQVDSTALQLDFRRALPRSFDEDIFFDLVKAGFGKRRKNILNAITDDRILSLQKADVKRLLARARIPETARAEDLMLKDFIRLAEQFPKGSQPLF